MSKIKSFRGLMADGAIEKVHLQTIDGTIGYKIVKLQVMSNTDVDVESTLKVYSVIQTTATSDTDFSDNTLLAAAHYSQHYSGGSYPEDQVITFDNTVFNQDIYITLKGHSYTAALNYYLELEQVTLDGTATAVATLKNIKNRS